MSLDPKNVQTLDRALDIIELLSVKAEGLGVTDIGNQLNLHKSTVHRLLSSLGNRGYIEKNPERSLYRLGLKFVEVSSLRLNHLELKTEATPHLRRLAEASGRPVHLAILSGTDAVYIEKIEPQQTLRMYSQIGRRIPVYCSALGKSLLAGLDDAAVMALIGSIKLTAFTAKTRIDPVVLLAEVRETRQLGLSFDDEEHEAGIRCVAAPVRDYTGKVIAAVSAAEDVRGARIDRDEQVAQLVRETAAAISKQMGAMS